DNLRELVANENRVTETPAAPGSVTGQADVQFMLQAARSRTVSPASPAGSHLGRTRGGGGVARAGRDRGGLGREAGRAVAERRRRSTARPAGSGLGRSQGVGGMGSAGMNQMDAGRQLGMTHDEVRLILGVARKTRGVAAK